MQSIAHQLPSDKDRDVLAEPSLFVDDVAPEPRVLREDPLERLGDGARGNDDLRAVQMARQVRSKSDHRHGC